MDTVTMPARPRWFRLQKYVYLAYLGMLVFQPLFSDEHVRDWLWTAALVAAFLPAYFATFRRRGRATLPAVLWMVLLGAVSLHFVLNSAGAVFFIYAAAAVPFKWGRVWTVRFLAALLALGAVLFAISPVPFPYRWYIYVPLALFVPLLGGAQLFEAERERANAKLRLAQEEVERLAAIAERERIARDLHDLLGHTLSTITLKSELAGRLIEVGDRERARGEVADVERISREALAEVRVAVTGYRQRGLEGEAASARLALETSGMVFSYESTISGLTPRQEGALAMALREAVTNVVRHARATRCAVTVSREGDEVVLRVADNGVGRAPNAGGRALIGGNGLDGIRERLRAVGGRLALRRDGGFVLEARLPAARAGAPDGDRAGAAGGDAVGATDGVTV